MRPGDEAEIDLSEIADEPPRESVEAEQAALGEQQDVGGTVSPDQSQSSHEDQPDGGDATRPFAPRVPDPLQ